MIKKLLILLLLLGLSFGQDRYEMRSHNLRFDKQNGELEGKICGYWYEFDDIEWVELSENQNSKFSYISEINGLTINNNTRNVVSISYTYKKIRTYNPNPSFFDEYSIESSSKVLCKRDSYVIPNNHQRGFKIVRVKRLNTGWFNF